MSLRDGCARMVGRVEDTDSQHANLAIGLDASVAHQTRSLGERRYAAPIRYLL